MVSFPIVGYRSIYPSQILGIEKSSSLKVKTGKPLAQFEACSVERQVAVPPLVAQGVKIVTGRKKEKRG